MLKERIKKLCLAHNTSLAKLENELGFGSGSISKWDKSSPKAENLKKVADYFGVSIDYLMSDDTTANPNLKPDFQLFGNSSNNDELSQEEKIKKKLEDLYQSMSEEDKKTAIAILEAIAAKGK